MTQTAFHDPAVIRRRLVRSRTGLATIECGASNARNGVIVGLRDITTLGDLLSFMHSALDRSALSPDLSAESTNAGWWAAQICSHANLSGLCCEIMRHRDRAKLHACLITMPGRMLAEVADWPLIRIGSGELEDWRGESAAPTDADLARYAAYVEIEAAPKMLRAMYDQGVIRWSGEFGPDGHRMLEGALPL